MSSVRRQEAEGPLYCSSPRPYTTWKAREPARRAAPAQTSLLPPQLCLRFRITVGEVATATTGGQGVPRTLGHAPVTSQSRKSSLPPSQLSSRHSKPFYSRELGQFDSERHN